MPTSHGTATCTNEHKHMCLRHMVQPYVPTSNGAGTCDVGTWCRHMCLRHMVQAHVVVVTHILVAPIVLAKPTANSPTGPHPEREGGRGGHMTWSHDLCVCTLYENIVSFWLNLFQCLMCHTTRCKEIYIRMHSMSGVYLGEGDRDQGMFPPKVVYKGNNYSH